MRELINNYNIEINIIISVVGVIISFFGAFFGKKAYETAENIYQDGIKKDKEKILEQLSLEFAIDFFIPFSKFKIMTENVWDTSFGDLKVSYVRDVISSRNFSIEFPFFNMHKGEIWKSLDECIMVEQGEAFNKIVGFVDMAKRFDQSLNDLAEQLNKCLMSDKAAALTSVTEATMEDIFLLEDGIGRENFYRGKTMMDRLDSYERELSGILKISEMKTSLYRKLL